MRSELPTWRKWVGTASIGIAICLGVGLVVTNPSASPHQMSGQAIAQDPSGAGASVVGDASYRPSRPSAPYAFLMTDDFGKPARWNPCEEISWSWESGSPKQRDLARAAFRKVSAVTSLNFVESSAGTKVRIMFEDLEPGILGYGSFYADPLAVVNGKDKDFVAKSGTLRVDPRATKLDDTRMLNLLMHEIGHIVGLAHVKARSQVMFREVQARTEFGAGDIAGLQQLGRQAGCLTRSN